MDDLFRIWVYLSGSPLFALFITLLAYDIGCRAHEKSGRSAWVNPVLVAVMLVVLVLKVSDVSYQVYFSGAQFVHFLLGTATVALALPVWRGWTIVRERAPVLLLSTLLGGAASLATIKLLALVADLPDELLRPMYVKSVTAPVAMGIAERIDAAATLAAVYAVVTGIAGALIAPSLLNVCGVRTDWQRGLAMGVAAHGIGTSAAFSCNSNAGLHAGVGMVIHGVMGAMLIPFLF